MSIDTDLRRQAQSLLDALAARIAESVRTDLEKFKAAVDTTTVAVNGSLSRIKDGAGIDALVQEVSKTARAEAQAAALQAKAEAEQRAAKDLAEARAAADVQASAAQAVNADLLSNLDDARRRLQEMGLAARTQIEQSRKELDEAHRAIDEARRTAQNAEASARTEVEKTRLEWESRLGQVETERRTLLEREEQLATDLALSSDRVRSLEETTRKLFAEARARTVLKEKPSQTPTISLDAIGSAFQAVYSAANARDLFQVLLEHLGPHFDRAAVFIVGSNSVKPWQVRGLPGGSVKELTVPRAIDALLARAVSERTPVMLQADGGEPPVGLLNGPVSGVMALPLISQDRVRAVAYVETVAAASPDTFKIAELLVVNVNRRLTAPSQVSNNPTDPGSNGGWSKNREARRVRMEEVVNVTLDGSASFLVDLSALGAQVLSPVALRPTALVRMNLLVGQQTMACKCRVVWASIEQQGAGGPLYRAGLQFNDADPQLLEAFLSGRQIPLERPSNVVEMPLVRN